VKVSRGTFQLTGDAVSSPQASGSRQAALELEAEINRGYEQRDRDNMGPTIAYFEALLAKHPGDPVLIYHVAGAYDTAGEEEKARGLYEQAMALGLDGDILRMCLCQYGSTLRWLERYEESLEVLPGPAGVPWLGHGPGLPGADAERFRPGRRGRR
jgi:Tfp pilus assembly protein PilF